MKHCFTLFVIGILCSIAVGSPEQKPLLQANYPGQPHYICDECVPRELILAPGIGFDLTSSYGTVAVRYHNKTIVDVGRVDGNAAYTKMIKRLSGPYKRYGPPFETPWDQIQYEYDQSQRRLRRLRGLPSTSDIEILSNFLINLKLSAWRSLRMSVKSVAISLPSIPNFLAEDWKETLEIAKLTSLSSYKLYGGKLYQTNAVWAGMGNGLCEHWGDIETCEVEEVTFGTKQTLVISFTAKELILENDFMRTAHWCSIAAHERYDDLGYEAWESNRGNETFWDDLGKKVRLMADKFKVHKQIPQDLLLIGDFAGNKLFLDAVEKALEGILDVDAIRANLERSGYNAQYVAARGAAELAKRWQGETWNCVEGDWCENRKPGEDGGKGEL